MGMKTLLDAYRRTVKRFPNHRFLGTRNKRDEEGNLVYSWKTFQEIYDLMEAFAKGKYKMILTRDFARYAPVGDGT